MEIRHEPRGDDAEGLTYDQLAGRLQRLARVEIPLSFSLMTLGHFWPGKIGQAIKTAGVLLLTVSPLIAATLAAWTYRRTPTRRSVLFLGAVLLATVLLSFKRLL